MGRELSCPHCGEPTFRGSQFVQAGLFTPVRCSMCGEMAGPTVRSSLVFFALSMVLCGALVLVFFLVEDPLNNPAGRMTRWEMLQRPTTWVLIVASALLTGWLYSLTLRLRRR